MTGKLAHRHEHLLPHRRLIVTRALAAGLVGLVPLPLLDDWAAATLRRGAVRRLAEARRVDLGAEAARAVADGEVPPPSWRTLLRSTALPMLLARAWRKAFVVFALARRAEEVSRTFAMLTLFDHYCARLHVGAGLSRESGREVRAAIDDALLAAQSGVGARLFRRALVAGGRAAVRAPFEILDAATGGTLRRLLARKDEAAAEEVVEDAVARSAASPRGFLGRAARLVEDELSRAGGAWLGDLIEAFERSVRARGIRP